MGAKGAVAIVNRDAEDPAKAEALAEYVARKKAEMPDAFV